MTLLVKLVATKTVAGVSVRGAIVGGGYSLSRRASCTCGRCNAMSLLSKDI